MAQDSQALKEQGVGQFAAGEFLKAAGSFTKALKIAEMAQQPALLCNRCASLLQLHKFPKALADAKAVTSEFPDFPKGHYRHGEVLLAMGKGKEADAAFARAVDLDPELRRPAATEQNPREVDGSDPIAFAHAIMGLVTKAHGTWPGLSWH